MAQAMHEIAMILVGLLAGSLLLEGLVLVPFWRTLPHKRFYELHGPTGPKLFRYFAPLTLLAVLSAVATVASAPTEPLLLFSAACLLATLVVFFLYFKSANEKLSVHEYGQPGLTIALKEWAIWHHLRTGFVLVGFASLALV